VEVGAVLRGLDRPVRADLKPADGRYELEYRVLQNDIADARGPFAPDLGEERHARRVRGHHGVGRAALVAVFRIERPGDGAPAEYREGIGVGDERERTVRDVPREVGRGVVECDLARANVYGRRELPRAGDRRVVVGRDLRRGVAVDLERDDVGVAVDFRDGGEDEDFVLGELARAVEAGRGRIAQPARDSLAVAVIAGGRGAVFPARPRKREGGRRGKQAKKCDEAALTC